MPLPQFSREVYQRNPLAEVVAQLRITPILRIDTEQPAAFQDAIRADFPTYRLLPALPPAIPQAVQRMMQELGAPGGLRQHSFGTEDGQWEIILTRESLVLKTKAYSGWQGFEARLRQVRAGFERAYQPINSYRGLNLRYVDVIQRSRLGLPSEPWSSLLTAAVAGELASAQIGAEVDKMKREVHFRVDDQDSFVWLRTGLVQAKDGSSEASFLIDSDFHTHTATGVQDVDATFQRFNQHSRNLFRWSIQDRLRAALQPLVPQ
jgi:uncharacterized protein (TIGR04255 family)